MATIVPVTLANIDDILRVQAAAYQAHYLEDAASFVSKIALSPSTCFGIEVEGKFAGYGISFPWVESEMVPLNAEITPAPGKTDCLYVHDIAILPEFRRQGLAEQLIHRLAEQAELLGLSRMSMIAVQSAATYWEKFGFAPVSRDHAGYGEDAVAMAADTAVVSRASKTP